jgi:2-polyprenyl-6-methoxyphenol hydroxylase-like FAD-dependent oxidoreductase
MENIETRCCIVGGGPAGMVLGWLLARAGVDVVVLEKHGDFFRDFRGDTIHPSTLELMHELGVLDQLLALPHNTVRRFDFEMLGERVPGPDFDQLETHCKELVLMPQWDFLDFVRRQAERYPSFHLRMNAEARQLLYEGERVTGVAAGNVRVEADLVIGADGRHSVVRATAKLPKQDIGSPMDALWMRIPRLPSDGEQVAGILARDQFLVMFDRGDYWQCAYLIAKGGLDALKQAGLPTLHARLRSLVPFLGDRVEQLRSWDDLKLLTVIVDRLERWHAPGLLCIGDAAHAMSPVGGVGINLAIQDAIAAANVLWQPLANRALGEDDLARVQELRESPTRRTQRVQVAVQQLIVAKVLEGRGEGRLKLFRWALRHVSALRRYMAHVMGVGFRLEHLEAPSVTA